MLSPFLKEALQKTVQRRDAECHARQLVESDAFQISSRQVIIAVACMRLSERQTGDAQGEIDANLPFNGERLQSD